jgi:hypothetical protein
VVELLDALADRQLEPAVGQVVDSGCGFGHGRWPAQNRVW